MKTMKGKLLKKLKTIKPIGYLKPERVLRVNASDFLADFLPTKSNAVKEEPRIAKQSSVPVEEPEIIDVSELMRDLEDDEMEFDDDPDDKENCRPQTEPKGRDFSCQVLGSSTSDSGNSEPSVLMESTEGVRRNAPLTEIDVSSFRRPELESGSLFDPNLLAAFEQAVMEVKAKEEAERRSRMEILKQEKSAEKREEDEPPLKARRLEQNREPVSDLQEISEENRDPLSNLEEDTDPLLEFEEKCPPGGSDSVIFYTTGLRGIRKTFEDCNSIRFLLESFRVLFHERDVSMHSEFREELWRILGGKTLPPRLFIRGRYIGGADIVLTLHEQGKLRPLFENIPVDRSDGPCEGCAGFRFVVCFKCSGSHRVVSDDGVLPETCPVCNENGLIVCPYCC